MRVSSFVSGGLIAALVAALVTTSAGAGATEVGDAPTLAWWRDGRVEARVLNQSVPASSLPTMVPVGSLWKLFVFAYSVERRIASAPYVCTAATGRIADEHYCCAPGEGIHRDRALARSCAPFFEPSRLGIAPSEWREHWRAANAPTWITDIRAMHPDTRVSLADLLATLAAISPRTRDEARHALLEVGFAGYGRDARAELGTGIRYKTYTWHRADRPDVTIGGAAGWLADGTPFWFGARGSSRAALTAWASQIASAQPAAKRNAHLAKSAVGASDPTCVQVDFFARYPIRNVLHEQKPDHWMPGTLHGRVRVEFENGTWLLVTSAARLRLDTTEGKKISGRFTLNEYVARVIDREASASQREASRALAIAARTYLLQNAAFEGGCWRIEDSTRTQRVSPNPPSEAALGVAWFTDEQILRNVEVRYHRDAPGVDRMSWDHAVAQAARGDHFETILATAYPRGELVTMAGNADCSRIGAAEAWLTKTAPRWARRLSAEAGYEPLGAALRVCTLGDGRPYADQARLRIYVRGWRSLDERIGLAHEYLHLAFRNHPRGNDEVFVERLARQLVADLSMSDIAVSR